MSINGGLYKALFRGEKVGCQVIQIFTCNASQWISKPLTQAAIKAFQNARQDTSIEPVAAHNNYLINLASSRSNVRKKSFDALVDEIRRAESLEIPYLVMHPGSHTGDGEKVGLRRVSEALNRIEGKIGDCNVKIDGTRRLPTVVVVLRHEYEADRRHNL